MKEQKAIKMIIKEVVKQLVKEIKNNAAYQEQTKRLKAENKYLKHENVINNLIPKWAEKFVKSSPKNLMKDFEGNTPITYITYNIIFK